MSAAPSFSEWFAARQQQPGAVAEQAPSGVMGSFFASESGAGATPSSPTAAASAAETSSFLGGLGGLIPSSFRPSASAADSAPEWVCGMSSAQRFQAFGLLLVGSLALYFAAIFLFLPMVIFMPAKFATTFTFASIMWMAAFAILRGPRATLRGLVGDRDKRGFTAAYVGSLALTLYSTMFTSSYFLPLVAICVQVSAMMWYTSYSVPGGQAAMGVLSQWCLRCVTGTGSSAAGAIVRSGVSVVTAPFRSGV